MNDGQLDDLKQFISSRISQAEERLESKIDAIKQELIDLRKEMMDGFAASVRQLK